MDERLRFVAKLLDGESMSEVCREFGVSRKTIANWIAQAAIDGGKPLPGKEGLTSAEREELNRLRRENRQLKLERDILSKAAPWFANKGDKTSVTSSNS